MYELDAIAACVIGRRVKIGVLIMPSTDKWYVHEEHRNILAKYL
ncbi:hypothetical protein [Bacillus sp. FJAT-50079]|nr:hypothetical protein [Bacillus sp. FJAT-50079]